MCRQEQDTRTSTIWSVLGGVIAHPHLEGCSKQKWTANA